MATQLDRFSLTEKGQAAVTAMGPMVEEDDAGVIRVKVPLVKKQIMLCSTVVVIELLEGMAGYCELVGDVGGARQAQMLLYMAGRLKDGALELVERLEKA